MNIAFSLSLNRKADNNTLPANANIISARLNVGEENESPSADAMNASGNVPIKIIKKKSFIFIFANAAEITINSFGNIGISLAT